MTFRLVDELLTRQMTGTARSPTAQHLDVRLVCFARGVAVCEMPLRLEISDRLGNVSSGVVTALAEAAMTAAAMTTVADGHGGREPLTREIYASFDRAVTVDDGDELRAEAVVMCADSDSVRVEAEVVCHGVGVAAFEATYARAGRGTQFRRPVAVGMGAAGERVA